MMIEFQDFVLPSLTAFPMPHGLETAFVRIVIRRADTKDKEPSPELAPRDEPMAKMPVAWKRIS